MLGELYIIFTDNHKQSTVRLNKKKKKSLGKSCHKPNQIVWLNSPERCGATPAGL